MNILFVSAETTPFSKAGGLGDVAGRLPQALSPYLNKVQVITPLYGLIDRDKHRIKPIGVEGSVQLGKKSYPYAILSHLDTSSQVETLFIESKAFFDRKGIYTLDDGTGFEDNNSRYFFFQLVILDLLQRNIIETDILHCNDHHSGLLPAMVKGTDLKLQSVFTIHNFLYHGHFSKAELKLLPPSLKKYLTLTQWDNYSALLTGVALADHVTTVSPGYAQELLAGENLDEHSHSVLQGAKDKMTGIINGIDTEYWNPEIDSYLPFHYSASDLNGKQQNKIELLKACGLDLDPDAPLIGSISRLVENKGFPLIVDLLDEFVEAGAGFIFLGSGDPVISEQLQKASKRHPGIIAFDSGFNEPLAHLIEAGSDLFLMPSRFEPCGLNQLYSLRYGTIPIVHKTGGLKDTVIQYAPGTGTGFVFEPYDTENLKAAIQQALDAFGNKSEWGKLMMRSMSQDFSWDKSARHYLQLYKAEK